MEIASIRRLTFLYAAIVSYGHCLVCYDNVVAGEPVFIGCNFPGAACAVTNKTATLRLGSLAFTENEVLYHCAHITRSCIAGPLKHCANSTLLDVDCDTWCCTTDKCNVPAEQNITAKPVPQNDALGCYQLVGLREEKVKCMFEDAQCLYTEIKSRFSFIGNGQKSASQLCVTKSHCEEMKKYCSDFNSKSWSTLKTCSSKCCNTDYCNPLPWNSHYNEKIPKNGNAASKDRPEWFKPGYTTTTQAPVSGVSTSGRKSDRNVDTNDDDTSAQLFSWGRIVLIVGISAMGLAILVAAIACIVSRRRPRRKYQHHYLQPFPRLDSAYRRSLT